MDDPDYHGAPLRTCVDPTGHFIHAIHRPHFRVANLRSSDHVVPLGWTADGHPQMNQANFPSQDVQEPGADIIFEIPNPFAFRGATYICKSWADQKADDPGSICIPQPQPVSLHSSINAMSETHGEETIPMDRILKCLPATLQLALAATSSDPQDLVQLAQASCRMHLDAQTNRPTGLVYEQDNQGRTRPLIVHRQLFEVVTNNPHLPDDYKEAMVLRPGVQGDNEIVGEWQSGASHVYEYLRRNSYIPWGHYAANMAHDAVRYAVGRLTDDDIRGMRHLYYQRTYVRLAESLGAPPVPKHQTLSDAALETMRQSLVERIKAAPKGADLPFNATLWGWNYGFGYASSGYRLHASHQQIHQQFAMVPKQVPFVVQDSSQNRQPYACGDLIGDFIQDYRKRTQQDFFTCYQQALDANLRLDERTDRPSDLVVYADEHVLLFVPKAQTSQWELQLMPREPVGNILEADARVRRSLDRALLTAMRILTQMGAAMISVIEYSKRFDDGDTGQRLLYDFLPKMPESPGAFSEAQLRWINGHYPEDFAQACRLRFKKL